nr:MAG TPA_asm: hypothetical protein [Caudoviricetes sp.]DAS69727.1 MAG TPA: hypothetical protein [Caudoviricetes sp.]
MLIISLILFLRIAHDLLNIMFSTKVVILSRSLDFM